MPAHLRSPRAPWTEVPSRSLWVQGIIGCMERCDFCELPVGGGCACSLVGEARHASGPGAMTSPAEARFPVDTILISPRGLAHRPGCVHQSDSEVDAPSWGWILHPEPQLWRRLDTSSPVRATHGNTERVATRRCRSCDP